MARPIGPGGIPASEWKMRVDIAGRVRELLGPRPVAELAKLLGDGSRTRAHKILNPDHVRGIGQSITLTLVIELARAFDMPLVEFLAPLLGSESAEALKVQANRRRLEETRAKIDEMVAGMRDRIQRPEIEDLIRKVADSGMFLTDQELAYETRRWDLLLRDQSERAMETARLLERFQGALVEPHGDAEDHREAP